MSTTKPAMTRAVQLPHHNLASRLACSFFPPILPDFSVFCIFAMNKFDEFGCTSPCGGFTLAISQTATEMLSQSSFAKDGEKMEGEKTCELI